MPKREFFRRIETLWAFEVEYGTYWPLFDELYAALAAEKLKIIGQVDCNKKRGATSSRKLKRITQDDYQSLLKHFSHKAGAYDRALILYLKVALVTGLRPIEWSLSSFDICPRTGAAKLIVQNAKYDETRAHGETRTLHWSQPEPEFVEDVTAWMKIVEQKTQGPDRVSNWQCFIGALGDALASSCRSIWPNRLGQITLYTFRHEAAFRFMKIYAPVEVAALLGHATDQTAYQYYKAKGDRAKLIGPDITADRLPTPDPNDVEHVRGTGWQQKMQLNVRKSSFQHQNQ